MKRIGAVLVTAALLLGLAATPASASVDNCFTVPRICVWFASDFAGSPDYVWTNPPNGCINFGSAINDKVRSVRNRAGWIATFYTDHGCAGQLVVTVSLFGSVGTYRNCSNSMGDGNGYWNYEASGCQAQFPNKRRISSVWVSN